MFLPKDIRTCIDMLEQKGFATYAVGGCVRDSLLGLTPQDYDLCTAATPDMLRQIFSDFPLVLAGEKHGTVTVIMNGKPVEITTFRLEGDYRDSRHPDWVRFVDDISADLSRRDFTVNAMAFSPYRGFADPFGGQEDLKNGILRAVGDPTRRFTEDALRILRGIRFSVRYRLTIEASTFAAMTALAPQMDLLAKERIFDELCKLLPLVTAEDLLLFAPVLTCVIPELQPAIGFDQQSKYHRFDLYTHTAHVVEAVPKELSLRLAALLHDIGKPSVFYLDEDGNGHFPGHAKASAEMADAILLRLKAPTALRKEVVDLIERHMTPLEPDIRILRRRLGKYGITQTQALLALQRADATSKGVAEPATAFNETEQLIAQILSEEACLTLKDLKISGHDLLQAGQAPGPHLGACLNYLLSLVQEDTIPNEKQALLSSALEWLHQQSASAIN